MNKITKVTIALSTLILASSSIALANFEDISENNYYAGAINSLAEKGVINGYPDNTFKPANKVTRAEFAKMISIAKNLSLNENNKKGFEDANNHWANSYIEIMTSNDLLKGYEDNTFRPQNEITYAEAATILLRVLDIKDFEDTGAEWATNAMNKAEELGLLNGVATNDLVGANSARRDNVALMIWNALESEKQNNEELDKIIDTKKVYIGTVDEIYERSGIDHITVNLFDGTVHTMTVGKKQNVPELNSLMLYKLSEDKEISVERFLTIEEVQSKGLLVEGELENIVKFDGIDKNLNLNAEEYNYLGEKIKLNKYTYYFVEVEKNDDDEFIFSDISEIVKEEVEMQEEDRVVIDSNEKIMFIVRGLEIEE